MSEDQFTSIQLDRDDAESSDPPPTYQPIHEEEGEEEIDVKGKDQEIGVDDDPSNSLLVSHSGEELEIGGASSSSGTGAGGVNDGSVAQSGHEAVDDEGDDSASVSSLISKRKPIDEQQPIHTEAEAIVYSINTSVTEPQREMDSNGKPFIAYLLTTVTDSPSIAKLSNKKVAPSSGAHEGNSIAGKIVVNIRRRYGDFKFLYDCLCNDYPQLLIPPLPSKSNFKYLTGDTFSTEFVHKRLNSLNRFIKFIAQHKILSQSKIFHLFVSDSHDWSTFQKNLKISRGISDESGNSSGNTGDLPSVVNKVVNEELLTETIMNFLTPSKHKRENNKDILEITDKLKKLYENLIKLDRIFAKLNKKNYDLCFDYEQFSNQITKLSLQSQSIPTSNGESGEVNGDTDIEANNAVTNNFKVFASSLSYFSENWSNLHKYIDESFLVSLKDCAKYIISLTNLIELQHNKKIDLQVLQDYLSKARSELANLGGGGGGHGEAPNPVIGHQSSGGGGLVNNTTQLIKDTLSPNSSGSIGSSHTENKKLKLKTKIEQLENEIQIQSTIVNDLTNRIIHEEYPFWDKFNKNELKSSMLGLCDEQILFYSGLVDKWSEAELKLMNRLKELS
ncbi:sorting nexin-4 [[Candida] railenensis]|uniref:Sorting nexin-4 n=1 Tax=[Candida] railenensis TaxID=45579 RepID=A0A9P0W0Y9_9ASCO|nr:sorting nexin-4 [[Candida] railenensis]